MNIEEGEGEGNGYDKREDENMELSRDGTDGS